MHQPYPDKSRLNRRRRMQQNRSTAIEQPGFIYNSSRSARHIHIRDRSKSKSLIQSIAILIAIYLLIFMVAATWNGTIIREELGLAIFSMTLVSVLLFSFSYFTASLISHRSFYFFLTILVIITLIKIGLVLTYHISPTSDYFNYHYLAYLRASGIPWTRAVVGTNAAWPHVLNIALLYSVPYSIIGTSFLTAQFLNIAFTLLDALLIYKLASSIINKQAGIFSALVFSLIPSYFLYSILNGAEPMFLTFVLGLLVSFDTFLRRNQNSSKTRWYISVFTMLILAILAYMVRPTIAIWLIAGLLYVYFRKEPPTSSPSLTHKRRFYYLLFFGLFILFSSLSASIYSIAYGMQIGSSSDMNRYSLATGTSPSTSGSYNSKIFGMVDKSYQTTRDPIAKDKLQHSLDNQITDNIENLKKNGHWLGFISQKYIKFADESYGYDWLLYNTEKGNPHAKSYFDLEKPLIALSVIYFEIMLILSIITMSIILLFAPIIPNARDVINKLFYFALLVDGFIVGSMIFEVQGRYHSILYIPLVMILALGVKLLNERKHKLNIHLSL